MIIRPRSRQGPAARPGRGLRASGPRIRTRVAPGGSTPGPGRGGCALSRRGGHRVRIRQPTARRGRVGFGPRAGAGRGRSRAGHDWDLSRPAARTTRSASRPGRVRRRRSDERRYRRCGTRRPGGGACDRLAVSDPRRPRDRRRTGNGARHCAEPEAGRDHLGRVRRRRPADGAATGTGAEAFRSSAGIPGSGRARILSWACSPT